MHVAGLGTLGPSLRYLNHGAVVPDDGAHQNRVGNHVLGGNAADVLVANVALNAVEREGIPPENWQKHLRTR